MSTRYDPDDLRDLEQRLTARLETMAARPRAAAGERVRAEIAMTAQRRGPRAWLAARMPEVAWTRLAAVGAVAVVALAVGVGIGTSGWLAVGKSPAPSPSGAVGSATPAPLGQSWQQVTIEPADTTGDYVVEGGYAGPVRTVLVGMVAGPAAEAGGHTTPAAWYSDDSVTWHRAQIAFGPEPAPLVRTQVFDLNVVFPAGQHLYAFGTAVRIGGPVNGSENASVQFESIDGGATWAQVMTGVSPTGGFVRDVAAGGPGYVAVGDRGSTVGDDAGLRIWTSTDGLNWQGLGDPEPGQPPGLILAAGGLTAIAAHDGMLMAVGTTLGTFPDNGQVLLSREGLAWTPLAVPSGMDPRDVTWAGDAWVIVGEIGRQGATTSTIAAAAWRSMDDGATWTQVMNGAGAVPILSVAAGPSGLVAAGDGTSRASAFTSTDGRHWEEHKLVAGPLALETAHLALVTGQGLLVAGGGRGPEAARLPYAWVSEVRPLPTPSPEPAELTPTPVPSVAPLPQSPIFSAWTRTDLPDPAPDEYGGTVAVGIVPFEGRWVAMGFVNGGCCDGGYSPNTRGVVWTSPDAEHWTLVPPQDSLAEARIYSVAARDDRIVAVGVVDSEGADGAIRTPATWYSTDGTTWHLVTGTPSFAAVTVAGSQFVAVSADMRVALYTSADGKTWSFTISADYPDAEGVVVQDAVGRPDGSVVVVGMVATRVPDSNVYIWTTPDANAALTTENLMAGAFTMAVAPVGDGGWRAVGYSEDGRQALTWTSEDGVSWSSPAVIEEGADGAGLAASVIVSAGADIVVTGIGHAAGDIGNLRAWVWTDGAWHGVDGASGPDGEIRGLIYDGGADRMIGVGNGGSGAHSAPFAWIAPR